MTQSYLVCLPLFWGLFLRPHTVIMLPAKNFINMYRHYCFCYFLPSLLNTFGIVDGHSSNVYFVASRYLLPACLILLTISIDLKAILNLGPKALIMFLTGTMGIVIGGPTGYLSYECRLPRSGGWSWP